PVRCSERFFFNAPSTTELYTLSLHDALPISGRYRMAGRGSLAGLLAYGDANAIVMEMANEVLPVVKDTPVLAGVNGTDPFRVMGDRKSTRLNSSHVKISYAVFCLKKKKKNRQ